MNQQYGPHHGVKSNAGVIIGFAVVAVIAAMCSCCSLVLAASSNSDFGTIFVLGLLFFAFAGAASWLVIIGARRSSVRAQQLAQQQAMEYQQWHAAYMAQQRYHAYVAWQQAEAAQREREARQAREAYMSRLHALDSLLNLTPLEFEQAICLLLESWGYPEVQYLGGVGMAVDIICRDAAQEITAVQCKRHEPDMQVGYQDIQKFIDVTEGHHVQHRMFVTTSTYTERAVELSHKFDILLLDGDELTDYLQEFRATLEQ
jgi:restriction endonuclease Mrr